MRHTITRTIIGIIWILAAVVCFFTANYFMTVAGIVAGLVYLSSAYSTMKKENGNK